LLQLRLSQAMRDSIGWDSQRYGANAAGDRPCYSSRLLLEISRRDTAE